MKQEFKHCLDFLIKLREAVPFRSIEKNGVATNSELRRWFDNGSVQINGEKAKWDDPVQEAWESLVLHPKGKSRITVW